MKKKYFVLAIPIITLLFFYQNASSQTYNAVDWGVYFNDNAHYPSFNFQMDDAINQVVVDDKSPESIYVVGRTYSAPNGSLTSCNGNTIPLKTTGIGFVAKYDRCGNLIYSTYIGSTIFCVALDKENNKTVLYVGGKAYQGHAFACDGSPVFQPDVFDGSNSFIAKYVDNDTVLSLSRWTFLGGTGAAGANDAIYSIAINSHKIFTCGITESTNLYAGAQHKGDTTYGGSGDGFVAQFDSLLSTLKFFTYIGGAGDDRAHDIVVSKSTTKPLSFYVSGSTSSNTDIAKGTGFQQTFMGVNDAFMCKWNDKNNTGVFKQIWGTYIGGTDNEHGRKSVIDNKGNLFLAGFTGSADFPTTALAYDTVYGKPGGNNSQSDAFVVKLSSKGGLIWSTYYGGSSNEEVNGLALFKKSNVQYLAITGVTVSPSTSFNLSGAIQTQLNGTDAGQFYDAYLAVFNDVNTQQSLMYSTYFGGSNDERAGVGQYRPSVAVGPHNILYYGGTTKSTDINTVVGSEFQDLLNSYNGVGVDAFLAKFINTTDATQYNCPTLGQFKNEQSPIENLENGEIILYPNPASGNLAIQFKQEIKSEQTLTIYNLVGRVMFARVVETNEGVNTLHLDVSGYTPGVYFVEMDNGTSINRQKLVIEK